MNASTILQRRMRALAVNDSDEKEFDFHYLEMDDSESSGDEYQDTSTDLPVSSNQNAQVAETEQQVNVVDIDAQAILEAHLQESGEPHRGVRYDFEYEEDEQERRFLREMPAPEEEVEEAEEIVMPITPAVASLRAAMADVLGAPVNELSPLQEEGGSPLMDDAGERSAHDEPIQQYVPPPRRALRTISPPTITSGKISSSFSDY